MTSETPWIRADQYARKRPATMMAIHDAAEITAATFARNGGRTSMSQSFTVRYTPAWKMRMFTPATPIRLNFHGAAGLAVTDSIRAAGDEDEGHASPRNPLKP